MHGFGPIFILPTVLAVVSGQVFLPQYIQPPPIEQTLTYHQPLIAEQQNVPLVHRDVVINAESESQLPSHLLNPFYKNPRIAQALAKESWFGPGEMHVTQRETEKIPRARIFSVLKNAGLARRRR